MEIEDASGDDLIAPHPRMRLPLSTGLRGRLRRRGILGEWLDSQCLLRVRAPAGRTVYVQEVTRANAGSAWIVYADGVGREAARQYTCPTADLALYRITAEVLGTKFAGDPPTADAIAAPRPASADEGLVARLLRYGLG